MQLLGHGDANDLLHDYLRHAFVMGLLLGVRDQHISFELKKRMRSCEMSQTASAKLR